MSHKILATKDYEYGEFKCTRWAKRGACTKCGGIDDFLNPAPVPPCPCPIVKNADSWAYFVTEIG